MGPCDPELVSALVDGEADDRETEAALRHLTDCSDCRALFERYSAVRGMIRGEMGAPAPTGMAERVAAAVAAEPPRRRRVVRLPVWGPRRGAALAAGLAAAAVITSLAWYRAAPDLAPGSQPAPVAANSLDAPSEPDASPEAVSAEPQTQEPEIQRYVQEHSRLLSGDARFRRTGLETSGR